MYVMPMVSLQNLTDDIDESSEDRRNVAQNLSHTLVRSSVAVDAIDREEADIRRNQHCRL